MGKLFLAVILVTLFSCLLQAQPARDHFQLKGEIAGLQKGWIYINYTGKNNKLVNDSSLISKGRFSFTGNIDVPANANLFLDLKKSDPANFIAFWIEPADMTIKVKLNQFKSAKFRGSATQLEFDKLIEMTNKVKKKYKLQLDSLSAEKDPVVRKEIRERLAPYLSEMEQAEFRFFSLYPQSFVTACELPVYLGSLSLDSARMFYANLGSKAQASLCGIFLNDKIQKIIAGSPGNKARNFTAVDIDQRKMNLSDLEGKYVLLDFWASWCVPCRKGNPHLRELYAKYKPKGMEFIGISDDDAMQDAWRKAVEKDSLPWIQILRGRLIRGKASENDQVDINEIYGISSLPTRILVDPKGMIIGRFNERNEHELDAMLKKAFGE